MKRGNEMAKFCRHCGNEIIGDKNFCEHCGENLKQETTTASTVNGGQNKNKIAAGLLGIFLGTFGIHNFYLGYTSKAVAQLLITVLSCGFLSGISAIWGLIEGIFILTGSIDKDADGNPLQE